MKSRASGVVSTNDVADLVDQFLKQAKSDYEKHIEKLLPDFSDWLIQSFSEYLLAPEVLEGSRLLDTASFKDAIADTASFEELTEQHSVKLLSILPRLPELERKVASLRWIEQLKYREIAQRLSMDVEEIVELDRAAQSQLTEIVIEPDSVAETLDRRGNDCRGLESGKDK